MTINEIRARMNTVAARCAALSNQESMSSDDIDEFENLSAEFSSLEGQLKAKEAAEKMMAASSTAVNEPQSRGSAPAVVTAKAPEAKSYPGAVATRIAMSLMANQGDISKSQQYLENTIGDQEAAAALDSTPGVGGALIPTRYSDEVIELLRPLSIVRNMSHKSLEMNGNLQIAKINSGTSSFYKGENEDARTSGMGLGNISLKTRHLVTLVPISSNLISQASHSAEQIVLNDIVRSMASKEDSQFLRGAGSDDSPTGLLALAKQFGNVLEFSGDPSVISNVSSYLTMLIQGLEDQEFDIQNDGVYWVFNHRTKNYLAELRDNNNNLVFPEMREGLLKAIPFKSTTKIPRNLGTSGKETEIGLVAGEHVMVADDDDGMVFESSKEATYKDNDGNIVSAFQRGQLLLRVENGHDLNLRHDKAVFVGTKVPF